MKFDWKYGKNEYQTYYDTTVNGVYLLVFANKWQPNIWMGQYGDTIIHDKTRNDRQRKRQNLPLGCSLSELYTDAILCSDDPNYMMKKVEHCFKYSKNEVCS